MNFEQRLRSILAERGAVGPAVKPAVAWEAFKQLGHEVFGTTGVGILFQAGVFTFSGAPRYYFDPVIQSECIDDEGEHDHFEQTHCELTCSPNEQLKQAGVTLWSFQFNTAEAYFSAVEAMPEFKVAMSQPEYQLNVSHEEV
jgi:hypothetical protein